MKQHTYILQSIVGRGLSTTITCFSYDNLSSMIKNNIDDMKNLGYKLVRQTRITISKKSLTNVTLYYQKI